MTSKSPKASKEPSRKLWWDYVFNVLASLTADLVKLVPVALVAIFTFITRNYQFATLQHIPWLAVCITYASTINGEAYYTFFEETPLFGPDGYVRITLRNYGTTGEHNSGWVFFFLRGADLSRYKGLRFLIRGETGSEKIGIKAKDARGVEVGLILDEGPYLRTKTLTTQWQEVTIPFTHFGNVDFGLVDNFSFFTRGDIAQTVPQTFYVGGFRLLP